MNDDLISRKAAIEAIRQYCIDNQIEDGDYHSSGIEYELNNLPSAQLEPRWIPVTERLPEEIGTYMTTIDYGKHGLAVGQRFYHGALGWDDECVIAWMPLSEPYREVK